MKTSLIRGTFVPSFIFKFVDDVNAQNNAHELESTQSSKDGAPSGFVVIQPIFEWRSTSTLLELLGISKGFLVDLLNGVITRVAYWVVSVGKLLGSIKSTTVEIILDNIASSLVDLCPPIN